MANTPNTQESSFSPGKKHPLLGISYPTANPWIRWGLPIASGLVAVLVLWFFS